MVSSLVVKQATNQIAAQQDLNSMIFTTTVSLTGVSIKAWCSSADHVGSDWAIDIVTSSVGQA